MNWVEPKVYAVKNKDEVVRAYSQSGGVFSALSDAVLSANGIIYGCVISDDFTAVHIRAEKEANRNKMRGSKYIQSVIGDAFKSAKKDLNEGKRVLFSGTSCQIAGLRAFLGKEYENLLCIDIVCHGVPSPLVWKEYLSWQEQKNHGRLISVSFRNKSDFGWNSHIETMVIEKKNGNIVKINSEIFKRMFYAHYMLRPCCHKCPYKNIVHPGDITIADYWGIDKAAPGFSDGKGVSLVLVNNYAGKIAFENITNSVVYRETRIEDSMQPPLIRPFEEPKERQQFWEDFYTKPFEDISKRYGGQSLLKRIRRKLGKVKRTLKVSFKEL